MLILSSIDMFSTCGVIWWLIYLTAILEASSRMLLGATISDDVMPVQPYPAKSKRSRSVTALRSMIGTIGERDLISTSII